MYYSKERLKKYYKNEKYYEFDKKLRILFLDFLEVVEINFRKNFVDFLGETKIDLTNKEIYRPKYCEVSVNFIKEKINFLKQKDINLTNFNLIENFTFGELIKIFQNLKARYKKNISKKYNINPYLVENWLFISRYLRNICSHYENLFNIEGKYKLDSKEIYELTGNNNRFFAYFLMLSIFEKAILGKNSWQEKIINLIIEYNIPIKKFNGNKKIPYRFLKRTLRDFHAAFPVSLKSEAWKEGLELVYLKHTKKSNFSSKKNFWQEQIKKYGKLCMLAPMDGYGDSAYRQVVKKIAPHVICVSEFYSADGLVHSKFLADSVLPHTKEENPLIMQIFGKDPEMFAQASKIIEQKKYDMAGIDVNMGCPAKKVVRSGHGSSLLINEQTAFKIIETMDKATILPVSVKTRLSFDGGQDLIKFGKGLEKAGCKLLTVHGRTAKQAYTGTADWTQIYELKENLNIPIIGNGDVQNYEDGMKKVKNLDGFMIGRASFGNPWCFIGEKHVKEYGWLDEKNFISGVYHPTLAEILDMMKFHAKVLVETKQEKKGNLEIRKHLVQYLKNFPGVKAYRKRLVTTESFLNTQNIIFEIREDFKEFLDKRPSLGEINKESLGLE